MAIQLTRKIKFTGIIALSFLGGLFIAGSLDLPRWSQAQQPAQAAALTTSRSAAATPAVTTLQDLSEAFASVAETVKPSVVYVQAERRAHAAGNTQRIPPEFERFFREYGFPQAPHQQFPDIQEASGSGFIVSPDGYILTNTHVVDGADEVTVRLLDRREFKAKVIGEDPATDVAVLKIDARNLTPAPLGNSDDTRVGEWVLAVGNPLGENLTFTVTSGIISAKGRTLQLPNSTDRSIQDFIQTDAAINPGNSGGPLVSVTGQVIGINSAIASQTGFYSGYGFAIPINLAREVMNQIVKHGHVERAAIGVRVRDATPNDAAYVGLPDIRGVRVEDFSSDDSPAKKAGIQPGDIIIAIDGKPVEYVGQLQQQVGFKQAGDVVQVEVARKGGVRKTYKVALQVFSPPADVASADDDQAGSGDDSASNTGSVTVKPLGVTVVSLDRDARAQLNLDSSIQGVAVTEVQPGGPSWQSLADPSRGGPDIILSVEGKPVTTPAELTTALKSDHAGDIVTLRVYNPRAQTRRIERIKLGN